MRILNYFCFLMIFNFTLLAQSEYTIQVEINSDRNTIWTTITDFSGYPQWNSLLRMSDNDDLQVGQKFSVTIIQPDGKKSKFKARTISSDAQTSFSARQTILGKWFFSATHYFIISEGTDSKMRFIQKWELTGIISKLFRKQIFDQLSLFNQMNEDLKMYLESNKTNKSNQLTTNSNQ